MVSADGRDKILDFGLARDTLREIVQGPASPGDTVAAPPMDATREGTIPGDGVVGMGYAPPAESWARADEEIRQVLALDPGNVLARQARANLRFWFNWDWSAIEREFRE
jgi:hypothetical protein